MCRAILRLLSAPVLMFASVAFSPAAARGVDGSLAEGSSLEAFTPAPLPSHRLVLRVSDAMLASYLGREIDERVSVRDVILGTAVTGTAHIEAQPCVKLLEGADHAAFRVEFRGTAVSRTVGRNGPAIIHSRSVTHFTATKQIVYETGKGFSGGPVQVAATTQNFTEGIDSTRGGLIGRIVRRRAAEQVAEKKSLTTEIARQKATRRIAAAFEQRMQERMVHLNQMVQSQSLWAKLVGGVGHMPYVCCSTPGHLQIAASRAARPKPIALPISGSASDTRAPVELWVHDSLLPERTNGLLESLASLAKASQAFDAFSALASPGTLLRKQSLEAAFQGLTSRLAVQSIEGWVVVEVLNGDQNPLARTAAVPAPVR